MRNIGAENFTGCISTLQANPFCREAEMKDLKKKCWREKVTAEITMTHVQQFAREMGANLSAAEAAQFLNQSGLAQSVWIHMMQAGEQYIKSSLKTGAVGIAGRNVDRARRPPWSIERDGRERQDSPDSYQ